MKNWTIFLGLIFCGALLLSYSWAPYNFFLGAMIGFVPLLLVEKYWSQRPIAWRKTKVYWTAYLFFAAWNFLTLYWVTNAAWVALISSVVVNSAFFAGIFLLFSQVKKYIGDKIGYLSFIVLFVAWEYIELQDWDLSWPWLTLGFSLADLPKLIQWYEYTGAQGGSFWLLWINYLVFKLIVLIAEKADAFLKFKQSLRIAYVVFIPVIISLVMYYNYEEIGKDAHIVVVQPNEDAYQGYLIDEKGDTLRGVGRRGRMEWMLGWADRVMSDSTSLVMFPESSMPGGSIWSDELDYKPEVLHALHWLAEQKTGSLLFGVSYRKAITVIEGEEIPFDAHYSGRYKTHYNKFNTALMLNGATEDSIYHKSRLVIGVERIPPYFVFLERYLKKFRDNDHESGIPVNFNHSVQEEREVFVSKDQKVKVAPLICYESIFGEYTTEYVQKGANLLGVITNDGWWGETEGYQQHFAYARLRAIENRRVVARSANVGTCGFIDQRGESMVESVYNRPTAFGQVVKLNEELTFFAENGNVLGRICFYLGVVFLINLLIRVLKARSPYKI